MQDNIYRAIVTIEAVLVGIPLCTLAYFPIYVRGNRRNWWMDLIGEIFDEHTALACALWITWFVSSIWYGVLIYACR